MFTSYFRTGDEVAVLPHDRAMPSDVLDFLSPAVDAALTGATLETTETPAHGCSVKYEKQ